MKKFAYLILLALLFAGCNNMLTNPDAFNSEDATVSMDISQLKARLATDGVVLTSTLDFVGDEPKHAPFEKTQTVNGSTVNYTIKGIPVGSSVQVKLSVFKNGILVFEGVSNKITIKEKSELNIGLNKNSLWISYFDSLTSVAVGFDANFSPLNNDSFKLKDPYGIYITTYDNGHEFTLNTRWQCIDNKSNVFILTEMNDEYNVYRFAPPYKTPVCLVNNFSLNLFRIYYDLGSDSLIITCLDNLNQISYYALPEASTTKDSVSLSWADFTRLQTPKSFNPNNPLAVYNNEFYWAMNGTCYKTTVDEETTELPLYTYNEDLKEFSGALANKIQSSFKTKFYLSISDITVTEEGVYALLNGATGYDPDTKYSSSRGGVIIMNHELTKANLYGWTESKRSIKGTFTSNGLPAEELVLSHFVPKNIKAGFYGPLKVVAIKPKKLVFLDNGGYVYIDDENNHNVKLKSYLVEFDLESCSWNSIEGDFNLVNSEFIYKFGNAFGGSYDSFTETWE